MESKIITCTECPNGCQVRVDFNGNAIEKITGFACPRGKTYAENEMTDPRRVLTSTVKSADGRILPVKSAAPVKKGELLALMKKVNAVTVTPPVRVGDVVYPKIDGEIDLVATSNLL